MTPHASLMIRDQTSELVRAFLASQDVRESSRVTYQRGLRRFFEWFVGSRGRVNPTREDILAFKGYLETAGLSSATLSTYLVAVRRFFEWAEGMRLSPNIARGIKGGRKPKGFRKDALTIEQAKALLHDPTDKTLQEKRDLAILNLLIRTGLRTVEIIRADIGDLRHEGGEAVLWVQGKGRDAKDDFVVLTPKTLGPLNEYLKARGVYDPREPLFASLSNRSQNGRMSTRSIRWIVKTRLRKIGVDNHRQTAHSLRHTAITMALVAGASIQEAQAMARHGSINTTLIYAHNIQRLAQAPERRIDTIL